MKIFFQLITLLFILPSLVMAKQPMTVEECFLLSIKKSETIAISEEQIRQASAHFNQYLGRVLPVLSFGASEVLQDDSANDPTSLVSSSFTRFSRPEAVISAYQPIFQGLREFQALKISRAEKGYATFSYEEAKRDLYIDVVTTVAAAVSADKQLATTRKMIGITRELVADLKNRVNLGKSRSSDLASQEALLARLEASEASLEASRAQAYEFLSFLTGITPHPSVSMKLNSKAKSLKEYLNAFDTRPDVMASIKYADMKHHTTNYYKGELLPTISAQANYYPYRVGFQQDIKWDATFNISVPIFQWEYIGDVREAKSLEKQAKLTADETQRKAEQEIRTAYANYQAASKESSRYNTAASKAAEAYRLSREDFQNGLISYRDLLDAQKSWFEMMQLADVANVQYYYKKYLLDAEAGFVPEN